MPGFLVQVGATLLCQHGGEVKIAPTNVRVLADKKPVLLLNDVATVSGCTLQPPPNGTSPPCVKVQWTAGTTRVLIGGQPALVQSSTGMCTPSTPPTPPQIAMTQVRVKGM